MSRRTSLALAMSACVSLIVAGAAAPSRAGDRTSPDGTVVIHWNAVAARTLYAENNTPVPVSTLYFGFVSLAVHDAVVAVAGGSEPYLDQPRARRGASAEAAATAAAYATLRHYFPASQANLAADYTASLAAIPDGRAEAAGIRAGREAAARLIAHRANDGRGAAITLDVAPAPGVWRPTPEAFAPMLAPWLGFVAPLGLRAPDQVRLPGPDPLGSRAYARDFAEVKAYGSSTSTARTPQQTATALFYNANVVSQYEEALRDRLTRRPEGIARTARAFALLGMSTADAIIGCWRAKYDDAFWRPITAIREAGTDGNPATTADPAWTPLVATPPYPDYTSGHACVTGAATQTFSHLFGARTLDLTLLSSVTGTTRHYDSAAALDRDTMNARIWLGLHFRRAMTDGNRLGHVTAGWEAAHHLRPSHR